MKKEAVKKVRIDKWLWSVRIFKTRTLAATKCKKSKVKINDQIVKASSDVKIGDLVQVEKNRYHLQFEVLGLIEKRVGAPKAQEMYRDLTPEAELKKFDRWYIGKKKSEFREPGQGRPTKKERRELEDFKKKYPF